MKVELSGSANHHDWRADYNPSRDCVGTRLIKHVEEVLFPNAANLYLFVSDINPKAIDLYVRLGYSQVGALPNFNLVGQTEFLHRKSRRPKQQRDSEL